MSASLVGSEMCIRDRASQSSGRRQAGGPRAGKATLGRATVPSRRKSRSCLLYTSDAADDM
eukprot:10045255-Alexandrium_andersonii.AAC.1